jgi:alkylation response protein AidB-like acyl-CoA dehydrogenase
MTEPESGSDAFGLTTVARRDREVLLITGRKTLITNAPVADVFIIFARSPGTSGSFGITAYLVEAGAPGLNVEHSIEKLGLRTSPMAEIVLDSVPVRADSVLGKPGRGAQVFATSMHWERTIIMAGALGALERSLEEAVEYAQTRTQFGEPIGSFQAVSDLLVNSRVKLDAARALLYQTAWQCDNGARDASLPAAVKLVGTETVISAMLDLLQVHGGHGYTRALPFERRLRDALGAYAYSGTSAMMRRMVARGMGL